MKKEPADIGISAERNTWGRFPLPLYIHSFLFFCIKGRSAHRLFAAKAKGPPVSPETAVKPAAFQISFHQEAFL
jgi:hypothetical protein